MYFINSAFAFKAQPDALSEGGPDSLPRPGRPAQVRERGPAPPTIPKGRSQNGRLIPAPAPETDAVYGSPIASPNGRREPGTKLLLGVHPCANASREEKELTKRTWQQKQSRVSAQGQIKA